MNTFRYLIEHQWKETRRAPMWRQNLVVNILLGLAMLYMVAVFVVLGFFADMALLQLFPEKAPMDVFNTGLLFYFGIEILLRLFVQSLPDMNVIPYLHLPVRRAVLMHYLLARSLSKLLSYMPFLVFIPFAVKNIHSPAAACGWLAALLMCNIIANLTVVYVKRQLTAKTWVSLVWGGAFALLYAADYAGIFSLSALSGSLFGTVLKTPATVLIFVAAAAGMYALNFRFLLAHAYPEEYNKRAATANKAVALQFANRFGVIGRMIAVEIKLIIRNKRTRNMMIFGTVFILFYSLMPTFSNILYMMVIFFTGGIMLFYAQMPFDGCYFDGILTRNHSISQYIRFKYFLYLLFCIVSLILCIPSMIIYPATIHTFISGFLYNIGINIFILLYIIGYGRESIALTKGSAMNTQGVKAYQFVMSILILMVPVSIVLVSNLFMEENGAYYLLGGIGLLGILFTKPLLNVCSRNVVRQKYAMAEGFRKRK